MDQFSDNNQFVDNKKSKWYKVPKFYAYIFLLCAFFIAGMAAGTQYQEPQTSEQVIKQTSQELKSIFFDNEEIDTELFEEVWTLLHDEYLEKSGIDDQDLFYGAISGMVEALGDPHTLFFNPEIGGFFPHEEHDSIEIKPGECALLGTGYRFGVPHGYMLEIKNRSGIAAKRSLIVGACVVDSGYDGEVFVNLHNIGKETQIVEPQTKIAQAVMVPVVHFRAVETGNGDLYGWYPIFSNRQSISLKF